MKVFLKDKPIGATTNTNRNFKIKSISLDDFLIASAIGFESHNSKPVQNLLLFY
jgi:hypothetical protein